MQFVLWCAIQKKRCKLEYKQNRATHITTPMIQQKNSTNTLRPLGIVMCTLLTSCSILGGGGSSRNIDSMDGWMQQQGYSASSGKEVIQEGKASWYGERFRGRSTASGEPFNPDDLTAAHKTLPFGTRVRVVVPKTGRSVVVRINDRGPFIKGRVIDLSRAAAERVGIKRLGVARVWVEYAD